MLYDKIYRLITVMLGIIRALIIAVSFGVFAMIAANLWLMTKVPSIKQLMHYGMRVLTMYYYRFLLFVCGVNINCDSDMPAFKKLQQPYLLVANHVSYLDIMVIGSMVPISFIAKSEVGEWPLVGALARAMMTIFVRRESVADRASTIRALRRNILHTPYCVFPEGTTTSDTQPASHLWHDGSFTVLKVACQKLVCMGIVYDDHEKTAWIDDATVGDHLPSFLRHPKTDVFVGFSIHDITSQRHRSIRELSRSARTMVTSHCREMCYSREKHARNGTFGLLPAFSDGL